MTIGVISFSGNLVFDYFFTIIFVAGLIAIGPSMVFRLLRY